MSVLGMILFALMLLLGAAMSYSDIRMGIIPNRWIVVFAVIGLLLDFVYYGVLYRDVVEVFFLNILTITAVSVVLYYTKSIAGGDCKLIPVMAILYPAGMYITYKDSSITLILSLCLAILFGYVYLLIVALWRIITGENRIEKTYVKQYILNYVKCYLQALIYVTFVTQLIVIIDKYLVTLNPWIISMACISVAWISTRIQVFKEKWLIAVTIAMIIILSIANRTIPISVNPRAYIVTALIIFCQLTIRTDIYDTIPTVRAKKGMILSTFSSMTMQNSKVKGLPGISSENLGDRITEDEAESIKRWGKTERGMKEITIVKKIPFAIFIFSGYLAYFLVWRIVA